VIADEQACRNFTTFLGQGDVLLCGANNGMGVEMVFEFHHVAIIVSDYEATKIFYTETLGLEVILEKYREARQSWKLDLRLHGGRQLEIFSFLHTPERPSKPEACGLRHPPFGSAILMKQCANCPRRASQSNPFESMRTPDQSSRSLQILTAFR